MEKNNLSQIFENSKSHIDKTIYIFLSFYANEIYIFLEKSYKK